MHSVDVRDPAAAHPAVLQRETRVTWSSIAPHREIRLRPTTRDARDTRDHARPRSAALGPAGRAARRRREVLQS